MTRGHVKRLALLLLCGCATLADGAGRDDNLPNALAGPFRALRHGELGNDRVAPYALRDADELDRDVSVVDADGDPATLPVVAFAAAQAHGSAGPPNRILRYTADDGRSFERQPTVVLAAAAGWEGGTVGAPSALQFRGGWLLYYAAKGGIGLATSSDGVTFARAGAGPVLGAAAAGWDAGVVPQSPGAVLLPDGVHLFYAASAGGKPAIGEAVATDGVAFTRAAAPVLLADGAYDAGGVGGPDPVSAVSPLGRAILWLYYGAVDAKGKRTVMAAARDVGGPFVRAEAPVFGTADDLGPGEPSVVRFDDFSLLFATELAGAGSAEAYPAVAVAVAPATLTLE